MENVQFEQLNDRVLQLAIVSQLGRYSASLNYSLGSATGQRARILQQKNREQRFRIDDCFPKNGHRFVTSVGPVRAGNRAGIDGGHVVCKRQINACRSRVKFLNRGLITVSNQARTICGPGTAFLLPIDDDLLLALAFGFCVSWRASDLFIYRTVLQCLEAPLNPLALPID